MLRSALILITRGTLQTLLDVKTLSVKILVVMMKHIDSLKMFLWKKGMTTTPQNLGRNLSRSKLKKGRNLEQRRTSLVNTSTNLSRRNQLKGQRSLIKLRANQ